MTSFAKLAKKAGKNWEAAKKKAAEFGSQTVENGRYLAQVVRFELGQSSSGRDQVLQEYKVVEGESKGEKVSTWQGLDSDIGITFFLKSLKSLGYEPEGLEDCDDILAEINKEKPKVRITVRGKDDGFPPNIFIDKVLSDAEVEDGADEPNNDDDGENGIELEVGMKVLAEIDGKEVECEVVKILEDQGKVKVKDEDGETHKVSVEDVSAVEGDAKKKEDKDEDPDFDEMDRDELEEFVEENDLEEVDVDSKKLKDDDDLREAVKEAFEGQDEEEDPDDKPVKKGVTKQKGSLKRKK